MSDPSSNNPIKSAIYGATDLPFVRNLVDAAIPGGAAAREAVKDTTAYKVGQVGGNIAAGALVPEIEGGVLAAGAARATTGAAWGYADNVSNIMSQHNMMQTALTPHIFLEAVDRSVLMSAAMFAFLPPVVQKTAEATGSFLGKVTESGEKTLDNLFTKEFKYDEPKVQRSVGKIQEGRYIRPEEPNTAREARKVLHESGAFDLDAIKAQKDQAGEAMSNAIRGMDTVDSANQSLATQLDGIHTNGTYDAPKFKEFKEDTKLLAGHLKDGKVSTLNDLQNHAKKFGFKSEKFEDIDPDIAKAYEGVYTSVKTGIGEQANMAYPESGNAYLNANNDYRNAHNMLSVVKGGAEQTNLADYGAQKGLDLALRKTGTKKYAKAVAEKLDIETRDKGRYLMTQRLLEKLPTQRFADTLQSSTADLLAGKVGKGIAALSPRDLGEQYKNSKQMYQAIAADPSGYAEAMHKALDGLVAPDIATAMVMNQMNVVQKVIETAPQPVRTPSTFEDPDAAIPDTSKRKWLRTQYALNRPGDIVASDDYDLIKLAMEMHPDFAAAKRAKILQDLQGVDQDKIPLQVKRRLSAILGQPSVGGQNPLIGSQQQAIIQTSKAQKAQQGQKQSARTMNAVAKQDKMYQTQANKLNGM